MAERPDIDLDPVRQMTDHARQALAGLRGSDTDAPDLDDIRGEGASDDGHARVVLDHTGLVESTTVDRHARNLGTQDLVAAVIEAYGKAREDLTAQLDERRRSGEVPDPYETNEKLLDLQEQSLRQSLSFIQNLGNLSSTIDRAAG